MNCQKKNTLENEIRDFNAMTICYTIQDLVFLNMKKYCFDN